MTQTGIAHQLVTFIRENLRPEGDDVAIDESTPLLELGILDSLKTAILLNYMRSELGIVVPPALMDAHNFKNAANLAEMAARLAPASAAGSVASGSVASGSVASGTEAGAR